MTSVNLACDEPTTILPIKPGREKRFKKRLSRRRNVDHSQLTRRGLQALFALLNLWIGWQFYQFVRYCEGGGIGIRVGRPAGVEGWLPIAALMNLKYWLLTGQMPLIHPAAMFLLIAFLGISWLYRKSFCSWLCPIGTISEMLWKIGRRVFKRNLNLPPWLDVLLRALKYSLLSLFIYAVAIMSPAALLQFMKSPYGLIADVKMLNFFRSPSTTVLWVLGLLALASILVKNFWCRYLCPYGALMGLAALLSPIRIRRNPLVCIDCAKCYRACPSLLPVDRVLTVRSAECTSCLECVAICPAEGALRMAVGKKRTVPAWSLAAGILTIFLFIAGYAKLSGHWQSDIPQKIYFNLVPRSGELSHP